MKRSELTKGMVSHGDTPIWFTGSRRTFHRAVYRKDDGTYWCIWYGQLIQLKRGFAGYFHTAELY